MQLNLVFFRIIVLLLTYFTIYTSIFAKRDGSILPVSALSVESKFQKSVLPHLSDQQLHKVAQCITVRVITGEGSGSGILINKKGNIYTVLTNQHVLSPNSSNKYFIETSDGKIHPAVVNRSINFQDNDLGILEFRSSPISYSLASLRPLSSLEIGDEVFAAGFPAEPDSPQKKNFVLTKGTISLFMEKPLVGGYQSGYTNVVKSGMSGGPLLNSQGEVVGINGRIKYALWGNSYNFKDGTFPPEAMRKQMTEYSWAIPIETFLGLNKVR